MVLFLLLAILELTIMRRVTQLKCQIGKSKLIRSIYILGCPIKAAGPFCYGAVGHWKVQKQHFGTSRNSLVEYCYCEICWTRKNWQNEFNIHIHQGMVFEKNRTFDVLNKVVNDCRYPWSSRSYLHDQLSKRMRFKRRLFSLLLMIASYVLL